MLLLLSIMISIQGNAIIRKGIIIIHAEKFVPGFIDPLIGFSSICKIPSGELKKIENLVRLRHLGHLEARRGNW